MGGTQDDISGKRSGASPLLLTAVILLAHLLATLSYFQPAISSPDANGYFKQARLIAESGHGWFETGSPVQFVAAHWVESDEGRYYSKYPPGLPSLLAVVYKLGGPVAALLVNPLLTTLTLLGLYLLCARWAGRWWGVFAVAVMAVNPVLNHHTLFADSHAAASFCLVWGVYLLDSWAEELSWVRGLGAGLLLGAIPSVRYAEAVFALGVIVFLVLGVRADRRALRSIPAVFAGAMLPVAALGLRNYLAFGAPWRTGYTASGEQTGFGIEYFLNNSVGYLQDIMGQGAGIIAAFAVGGVVLMCAQRATRRRGILLAGLIIPATLVYMSYYFYPNTGGNAWPTLRFLLPTFYLYALAAAWFLAELSAKFERGGRGLALAVLAISLCWGAPQSVSALGSQMNNNEPLAEITRAAVRHVPAGAVLVSERQIAPQLDYIGRWNLADGMFFDVNTRMPRAGMPMGRGDGPNPRSGMEKRRAVMDAFGSPGGGGLSRALRGELNRWAGSESTVYWIGNLDNIRSLVDPADRIEVLAELELLARERPGGGMMMRGNFRGGMRNFPGVPPQMGGTLGEPRRRDFSGAGDRETEQLALVRWTMN